MQNTDPIWDHVERHRDGFIKLSDAVFDTPETLYNEYRSVAEHKRMLEAQGFRVTENAAGIPTAVIGEAGKDGAFHVEPHFVEPTLRHAVARITSFEHALRC